MIAVQRRIAGVLKRFRRDPQEREYELSQKQERGRLIEMLLNSEEYKNGLKPLLDNMRNQFTGMLQRGHELEPDVDKARGALDCLDKIQSLLIESIQIGKKAETQLTQMKERIHARRSK